MISCKFLNPASPQAETHREKKIAPNGAILLVDHFLSESSSIRMRYFNHEGNPWQTTDVNLLRFIFKLQLLHYSSLDIEQSQCDLFIGIAGIHSNQ